MVRDTLVCLLAGGEGERLYPLTRDRATAEDCAQEKVERAYRTWASWRPDAPVEAWLHRIAINVAISDRRHQRIRQAGELIRRLGRPAPVPDPADVAERSDLFRAIKKLPPRQAATAAAAASPAIGGRPDRGRSRRPAGPAARKRVHHACTLWRATPNRCLTAV